MSQSEFPAFFPADQYSRRLAENLHPPDWQNPRPNGPYNLVVVGGGTAGLVTAAAAAGLGAKTALVERRLLGGDCLNYGCVPSKSVLRASRAWAELRDAKRWGLTLGPHSGDFGAVMERMRRLRAEIAPHDSAARFRDLGVDVYLGSACFTGERSLEVAGERLEFARACVATGGRPRVPEIPGLVATDFLTSETVFSLTELPRRLIVLGGGPIGCELAQAFARFGAQVTLVQRGARLLPKDDPEAGELLARRLAAEGVDVRRNSTITRGTRSPAGGAPFVLEIAGPDGPVMRTADALLAATGRQPNLDDLGLDAAGVTLGPHGVQVDAYLRTSNRRIYAAGDVCSPLQFTHLADAHARIVVRNALFFGRARDSSLIVPWCTYTDPEVAQVGLTQAAAEERGINCDEITIPLDRVDRAVLDDQTDGYLRVRVRRGSDRLLGGSIVASHAGEMIGALTLAVSQRIGLKRVADTIFPYPTQAEAFKKAADAFNRGRLTPRVAGWLRRLMAWRRG